MTSAAATLEMARLITKYFGKYVSNVPKPVVVCVKPSSDVKVTKKKS